MLHVRQETSTQQVQPPMGKLSSQHWAVKHVDHHQPISNPQAISRQFHMQSTDDGLQGKVPEVQAAMDLYHILSESDTHLRQPVALESQLLADEDMDDDVGRSMLQLLQVRC